MFKRNLFENCRFNDEFKAVVETLDMVEHIAASEQLNIYNVYASKQNITLYFDKYLCDQNGTHVGWSKWELKIPIANYEKIKEKWDLRMARNQMSGSEAYVTRQGDYKSYFEQIIVDLINSVY